MEGSPSTLGCNIKIREIYYLGKVKMRLIPASKALLIAIALIMVMVLR